MRRKLNQLLEITGGLAIAMAVGALLLSWGLVATGQEAPRSSAGIGENDQPAGQPIRVIGGSEGSKIAFDEGKYTSFSTRIVRGRITSILPAQWDDSRQTIETPFIVSVTRHIKGDQPQATQTTVFVRGGTIGKQQWVDADAPEISVGDEGLFFTWSSPNRTTEKQYLMHIVNIYGNVALPHRVGPEKGEPVDQVIANVEAAMRGQFRPTPTPTLGPIPTLFPSGGLYPPKPARPVQPGE